MARDLYVLNDTLATFRAGEVATPPPARSSLSSIRLDGNCISPSECRLTSRIDSKR